ncbi:hypothetical protein SAMN04488564_11531 [Lentzea waywayandensis]|uniref:Uncharacterized protein n=1 Tax=Lentzea waywayandensis TaxID=84724 RepID=A0A1I6FFL2_9PSEU|nr:hypothetical protein [Lentzea waywayandensis]SFR28723.1 hypothetical protein SAMN04488564_11531 [Lentzea waywayandensis]
MIGWAREVAAEDGGDFRSTAIAVIEYQVLGGLMAAGEIGDDGFEEWPGTPAETVRNAVEKCEALNWEPFGAACWLSNAEAGDVRLSWWPAAGRAKFLVRGNGGRLACSWYSW